MGRKWNYQESVEKLSKDDDGTATHTCFIDFKNVGSGGIPKMFYRHLNRAAALTINRIQFSVYTCSQSGLSFLKELAATYGAEIKSLKGIPDGDESNQKLEVAE